MADMMTLSDGRNTYNIVDAGAVRKNQGSLNAGKYLVIDSSGNVVVGNAPSSGAGGVTEERVNQLIDAKLPRSAEGVLY